MLDRLVRLFTSLKLTVVLLTLGMVLVFWGTLAQVHLGLYRAQNEFFRSFFVFWQPAGSNWQIPIFPGGYLLGGLLLINLLAIVPRYYLPWQRNKLGTVLIHSGVVLLIFGQLLTDLLSQESSMHIRVGGIKNYSEADRSFELAVIDTTDPKFDQVVAIPGRLLAQGGDLHPPDLPFTIRVKKYYPNAALEQKPTPGYEQVSSSAGIGAGIWWRPLPHETATDRRDMPSGLVELLTPRGSLGSWFISAFLARPQELTWNGRRYELVLRPQRFYKPFSLQLLEFKHDKYPGTDIPKNFSSRVRLRRPGTGEDREVLIYMNNPLRYAGETFYQASFDPDDRGSVLQVVHNPSWLTPYFSCVIVAVGLVIQFVSHLFGYATNRRNS